MRCILWIWESALDFVFDVDLDLFLKSEFESVLDFVFDSVIVYRFGKVCLNRQLYNYSLTMGNLANASVELEKVSPNSYGIPN